MAAARIAARLFPAAVLVLASQALAQVADTPAHLMAVTIDKAPLRCNDSDRFYKVTDLAVGSLLVVDGEGHGWARAAYPQGTFAFVRAEDVSIDGSVGRLSQPSRLKAANAVQGYEGSFKALFSTPLPQGTTLQVVEPVKDTAGSVSGYKVVAPTSARGFVESRALRPATPAEIETFKVKFPGALGTASTPAATPTPATTTPATSPATTPTTGTPTAAAPTTTPAATPATTPSTTPTTTASTPPTDLTQAPKTGQSTPVTTPVPGAEADKPTELVQHMTPKEGSPDATSATNPTTTPKAAPTPAEPKDRVIATAEKLEQTLRAVWQQDVMTSEFDELIAEYDRAIEATPADRPNLRAALEGRRKALELRREYRDTLRRQADARASLDEKTKQTNKTLEAIAASRYYTIIGQVQPSLVYDGKMLPQMYRVVSVGGVTPRTLGYLRRSTTINLDTVVGQVVGVIGEAELDRSLQLNLITPVTVDVLKVAPGTTASAPEPTETPGSTEPGSK